MYVNYYFYLCLLLLSILFITYYLLLYLDFVYSVKYYTDYKCQE